MKIFADTTNKAEGYGRVVARVRSALALRGIDTTVNTGGAYDLVIAGPGGSGVKGHTLFTMWEPDAWIPEHFKWMRTFKRIIVPSQHNLAYLRSKGFKNVRYCPLGVPLNFAFLPAGPLTFLSVGQDHGVNDRKRSGDVIRLFQEAFPVEPDVRLIVKQSPRCREHRCFDTRVRNIRAVLNEDEMLALRRSAHVGIQPSGLEGWGLPAHEMLATGRPVIATLWGGHANFLNANCTFPLEYKFCRAPKEVYKGIGMYARATDASILRAFRWCYENPEEIALKGAMAFKQARHFTPEHFGARLWEALQ